MWVYFKSLFIKSFVFYGDFYSDILIISYLFVSLCYNIILAFFVFNETTKEDVYFQCYNLVIYNHILWISMIFGSIKTYIIFKFHYRFNLNTEKQSIILNLKLNTILSLILILIFTVKFNTNYEHAHCRHLQSISMICFFVELFTWSFQFFLIKNFEKYEKIKI